MGDGNILLSIILPPGAPGAPRNPLLENCPWIKVKKCHQDSRLVIIGHSKMIKNYFIVAADGTWIRVFIKDSPATWSLQCFSFPLLFLTYPIHLYLMPHLSHLLSIVFPTSVYASFSLSVPTNPNTSMPYRPVPVAGGSVSNTWMSVFKGMLPQN